MSKVSSVLAVASMKIFEVIHLILLVGFVVGVPIAGTARLPGQEFSWSTALKQAAIASAILIALLALNFIVARFVSRRVLRKE
jgi:hypothetical protein